MTEKVLSKPIIALFVVAVLVLGFNQMMISQVTASMQSNHGTREVSMDLKNLQVEARNTAYTLSQVFPLQEIQTTEDAMAMIFPTGTPEYGEALGVSYDDPVPSLAKLSSMFKSLKSEVEQSNPEAFDRFINLASNPYGVSCEYCCGVGPSGADKKGNSRCGCQHNPALLSLSLYLSAYTDYSDAEILREVMKWKTLFFPKKMIEQAMAVAGGDTSALDQLPGMVGGC